MPVADGPPLTRYLTAPSHPSYLAAAAALTTLPGIHFPGCVPAGCHPTILVDQTLNALRPSAVRLIPGALIGMHRPWTTPLSRSRLWTLHHSKIRPPGAAHPGACHSNCLIWGTDHRFAQRSTLLAAGGLHRITAPAARCPCTHHNAPRLRADRRSTADLLHSGGVQARHEPRRAEGPPKGPF